MKSSFSAKKRPANLSSSHSCVTLGSVIRLASHFWRASPGNVLNQTAYTRISDVGFFSRISRWTQRAPAFQTGQVGDNRRTRRISPSSWPNNVRSCSTSWRSLIDPLADSSATDVPHANNSNVIKAAVTTNDFFIAHPSRISPYIDTPACRTRFFRITTKTAWPKHRSDHFRKPSASHRICLTGSESINPPAGGGWRRPHLAPSAGQEHQR